MGKLTNYLFLKCGIRWNKLLFSMFPKFLLRGKTFYVDGDFELLWLNNLKFTVRKTIKSCVATGVSGEELLFAFER